jgi:chemotaxis protein MotB
MAKKRPISQPGVPEWVLTYGDLMSLLLCFFILLAAFSELKQPREYQRVLEAIKEALGSSGGMGLAKLEAQITNSVHSQLPEQAKRDGQKRNTDETPIPNVSGQAPRSTVIHQADRAAIGGSLAFDPGTYQLPVSVQRTLKFEIAPLIRDQRYVVHVTGHSWGPQDRISGMSHAELSFKRAEAVVEYLIQDCEVSPQILRIVASGEQEPMQGSLDVGNSSASNRRVQLYQTGQTVDQMHPDPSFTGRSP